MIHPVVDQEQPAARGGEPIRVAVVDDQELFRRGLTMLLGVEDDIEVVGEAGDGVAATELAATAVPDVILMDVRMPKRSGIEACIAIKEAAPTARIIMLTVSDEEADLYEAVKNGASGYLLKDSSIDEVAQAVRVVADGQSLISPSMAIKLLDEFKQMSRSDRQQVPTPRLTDRELEVLKLVAQGLNNREIAKRLFISENTVKNHVRNILEKLQLHSRMEAVMYAVREKLLDIPCSARPPSALLSRAPLASASSSLLQRADALRRQVTLIQGAQARRIALAAQGFRDPRHTVPTMRTFDRTLARTAVLQIDSVNVLQRAHYMPLFSRMGPYDTDLLTRAAERSRAGMVEYWAHVAAFMPVELWPHMRHRMRALRGARARVAGGRRTRRSWWTRCSPRSASGARRPRATSTTAGRARKEHWGWNWSESKKALEYLFAAGRARRGRPQPSSSSGSTTCPERVMPRAVPGRAGADGRGGVRRAAAPRRGRARRRHRARPARLLPDAARADQARAAPRWSRPASCCRSQIEGWNRPAYLHRDAALPRRVDARALLSPFDPVVWERHRTEHLFDFHYRIEIYVPQAKRVHGYYVLPFLLGDRIVGRVDLKADRRSGVAAGARRLRRAARAPETGCRARGRAARPGRLARAGRHRGRAPRRPGRAPGGSCAAARLTPDRPGGYDGRQRSECPGRCHHGRR